MKKIKKPLSLIFAVIMVMSSCFIMSSAKIATNDYVAEQTVSDDGTKVKDVKVQICANKGNWQNYPENSLQAVQNCSSDYVSVDIKVTSDGIPVLMADDTVERTCVDESGKTAKGKVSDYTFEKIQKLYLRNGNGGPHNQKTEFTVPSLKDVISLTGGKSLILDFKTEDLDKVYKVVYDMNAQTRVVLRPDGKAKDVIAALAAKETVPETIVKYDGSIIFGVNKAIQAAKDSGLHMVQLGSRNQYGVIFYESVENKIRRSGLRAVFSMTDGYNAKRNDNVTGWDDVISHGYSIIETDYPEILAEYVSQSEIMRQRLMELTGEKEAYKDGSYPRNLTDEYGSAYNSASETIKNTASQSQLAQCYTRLNNARNALNVAQGTKTAQSVLNFSIGRIIAAVLCLAAAVAAQIFFYKRRKK